MYFDMQFMLDAILDKEPKRPDSMTDVMIAKCVKNR